MITAKNPGRTESVKKSAVSSRIPFGISVPLRPDLDGRALEFNYSNTQELRDCQLFFAYQLVTPPRLFDGLLVRGREERSDEGARPKPGRPVPCHALGKTPKLKRSVLDFAE
jgi:hypothetical protein